MKQGAGSQVITFYSYKGGTGRTMALANVGCLLARDTTAAGDVLMIDWDLEAPGLHRFFSDHVFPDVDSFEERERRLMQAPGLIDLFCKWESHVQGAGSTPDQIESSAERTLESLLDAHMIATDVPRLYLMKAGAFDGGYSERINRFRWEALFERCPVIFSLLARTLAQRFRYVLIDSRTGHTDTSGICTMLVPEKLVVVFTPNRQSLTGALDLVRTAAAYRRRSDDLRPLSVFPLASRVELAEPRLRELWRAGMPATGAPGYQPAFEALFKEVYDLPRCDLADYFDEVQIQQLPRYAYGESIAVLDEPENDRLSLTRSYQNFARRLVQLSAPWEQSTGDDSGGQIEHKARLRVGRYTITRTIAESGMGAIYLGVDSTLRREIAIKTVRPGAADATAVERLFREARAVASLHHPNIVTIYDLIEDHSILFIVMEKLNGHDFREIILRREPLPLLTKLDLMAQTCSGVHHAHEHGILHGDLKPANLFVTGDGLVKVMDFALSKFAEENTDDTQVGLVAGTPSYMPPERLLGQRIDNRSDIFSLGATFYELLAYKRAFEGDSIHSVLLSVMELTPAPLTQLAPDVPPVIADIIHRCLAKKPDNRYQTVRELRQDLLAAAK